jgi:hypothetical protein
MSAELAKSAVDLLWKQWTALGVNGVAKLPEQAIDLEALIAFTPFLHDEDPRLVEESCDWCVQFGHSYASMSRLKQVLRMMPPRDEALDADPVEILLGTSGGGQHSFSQKSHRPNLRHPSLLQLRSRCIFGVGARADLLSRLAVQLADRPRSRIVEMRPAGYSKQTMSGVVSELTQGGLLKKHEGPTTTYSVAKPKALRNLLSPLPHRLGDWAERFALVAHLLTAWRRYGKRATYIVEVVRILDEQRALVTSIGPMPPLAGRPDVLKQRLEPWALGLLVDKVWESEWKVRGDDVLPDIVEKLEERLVEIVHSDIYPVGFTELADFSFRMTDPRKGVVEFSTRFSAEHPNVEFSFDGYVEGQLAFDPKATTKSDLVDSVSIVSARAHFNLGDEDERD